MSGVNLKFHSSDSGFCRVYYKTEKGTLCCFQNEGDSHGGILFYKCTPDGEPEFTISIDKIAAVEIPRGGTDIDAEVFAFFQQKRLKVLPSVQKSSSPTL